MTENTTHDTTGRLILNGWVDELDEGEIFVFGSNAGGAHGGGAARIAHERFGAVWGEGHGLHGRTYAIDTMTDEPTMAREIEGFVAFAAAHPELTFLVTELGCGIGPYRPAQVAPYLADAGANVALPPSFADVLADAGTPVPTPAADGALTAAQLDRAVGAVVGMAVGDALGAPYEFGPAHGDDWTPAFGVGVFGHAPGEWTDDTSMAMPILDALARGESLRDPAVLGRIVGEWDAWAQTAKDVGSQTRAVLAAIGGEYTEDAARAASEEHDRRAGRSGGNGSLMRTAPVALGYLRGGAEDALADAAGRVAQLTHWEADNVDATVIWSLMIRHAILTGEIVVPAVDPRWAVLIDECADRHPRDFQDGNGWVVRAFQAALAAVRGATDYRDAVERAVRGGADTDTVAAIAGALAGAQWGASQIPAAWRREVHGWPGYREDDLVQLVERAIGNGAR